MQRDSPEEYRGRFPSALHIVKDDRVRTHQYVVLDDDRIRAGRLEHARHGEAASRFVKVHAQEDQDHVRKAIAAVNELPPAQQAGVARNFSQACEMYFLILRSIRESTDSLTTAPLLAATEAASLEIAS